MRRQVIESSVIRSVGYDPSSKTLEIEFEPGDRVYQYFDVPEAVYQELLAAPSRGHFFNERIKGTYPSIKTSQR